MGWSMARFVHWTDCMSLPKPQEKEIWCAPSLLRLSGLLLRRQTSISVFQICNGTLGLARVFGGSKVLAKTLTELFPGDGGLRGN